MHQKTVFGITPLHDFHPTNAIISWYVVRQKKGDDLKQQDIETPKYETELEKTKQETPQQ